MSARPEDPRFILTEEAEAYLTENDREPTGGGPVIAVLAAIAIAVGLGGYVVGVLAELVGGWL